MIAAALRRAPVSALRRVLRTGASEWHAIWRSDALSGRRNLVGHLEDWGQRGFLSRSTPAEAWLDDEQRRLLSTRWIMLCRRLGEERAVEAVRRSAKRALAFGNGG